MLSDLRDFIKQEELLLPPDRAVTGLSGGVDSVVLFRLLLKLGVELHAVHLNYQLRGQASDEDEAFVREMCREAGVPLTVHAVDIATQAEARGQSLQEAAREERYRVFEEIAGEESISRVAVGHQRDDQIETILLHLLRGTGLKGLAGMRIRRPIAAGRSIVIIRPLLFARRREIERYAREQHWTWRTDQSNASGKYLRNALRADILPRLEEHVGSGGLENIARTGDLMRAYLEADLLPHLEEDITTSVETVDDGIAILTERLSFHPPIWQQQIVLEVLKRYFPEIPQSQAITQQITGLLASQVGRKVEIGSQTVWRERDRLLIAPANETGGLKSVREPLEICPGQIVHLPGAGRLSLDRLEEAPVDPSTAGANTAFIDATAVQLPMRVRPWQEGDHLQPLGMQGRKKVSDLLTEAKVPPHRRRHVYVVTSDDEIIWVVGYRLAHAVRLTADTRQVLELSFE